MKDWEEAYLSREPGQRKKKIWRVFRKHLKNAAMLSLSFQSIPARHSKDMYAVLSMEIYHGSNADLPFSFDK